MAGYNRVIILGNLTRDPEHKQLASGQAVCRLGLASNRQFKNRQSGDLIQEVCYVDVDVWGAQAESCRRFLEKGRSVLVEGRLKYDSWDQNGQSRSKLSIVADRVFFLGNAKDTFEGASKVSEDKNAPEGLLETEGRTPVQSEMERELFDQIERLKNREPLNSAKELEAKASRKKKAAESAPSQAPTDFPPDFSFKDEPPFQDDLPF